MKNLLTVLILASISGIACADTEDLEQMLKTLHSKNVAPITPSLPQFVPANTNFKIVKFKNLFSQDRLQDTDQVSNTLQNYTLNQLQMVGFMKQKDINYAFIKTPYETLLVKAGDKIKLGSVVSVAPNIVEIEELQTQDDRTYHKKVYVKFDTTKNDNNLKLKLQ